MASKTLAAIINPVLPYTQTGAIGSVVLGRLISNVIDGMLIIGVVISFIYLITGGFHWITSGGDKGNLESARNKIIHAMVGLIVLASAWAIMTLVGNFLGLDFTKLPIPSIDQYPAGPK